MSYLISYMLSWLGVPYIWGGDSRDGIDCSGFVQKGLACVGEDPPGDQTAQKLFDHFEKIGTWNSYQPGALAFFGESATKITHVAFLLDRYLMIEAGGGDRSINSVNAARLANAEVRIRPITHRQDLVAVIRPRYARIGLI